MGILEVLQDVAAEVVPTWLTVYTLAGAFLTGAIATWAWLAWQDRNKEE